jgi:hypothetical protein
LGSKSSSTITAYQDAASRQIGNFRAPPPEDAFTARRRQQPRERPEDEHAQSDWMGRRRRASVAGLSATPGMMFWGRRVG